MQYYWLKKKQPSLSAWYLLFCFVLFKYVVPKKHDRICFTSLLSGSNPSGFVRSMVCNNCTHPRWLLKTLWNAICQACVQPAACHSATRKEEAGALPGSFLPASLNGAWYVGPDPARVAPRITGCKPPASLCRERFCLGNKPWRSCWGRLAHLPTSFPCKMVSLLVFFFSSKIYLFFGVLDYFKSFQKIGTQEWLLFVKWVWQIRCKNMIEKKWQN
jgi:hypothetical protein